MPSRRFPFLIVIVGDCPREKPKPNCVMNKKQKNKTETTGPDARIEEALERLRKSKEELGNILRTAGKAAGRRFVLEEPMADAFCHYRLKYIRDNPKRVPNLTSFVEALLPDTADAITQRDSILNYLGRCGYQINTEGWREGFVEGALAQFAELEQKLEDGALKPSAGGSASPGPEVTKAIPESTVRNRAYTRGLGLQKSTRRDPKCEESGTYQVRRVKGNEIIFAGPSGRYGMTLEQCADFISSMKIVGPEQRAPNCRAAKRSKVQQVSSALMAENVCSAPGQTAKCQSAPAVETMPPHRSLGKVCRPRSKTEPRQAGSVRLNT